MPNQLNIEIQSRISAFLDKLSALVKLQALEAVHEALGEVAGPARLRRGRPRRLSMRPGPRRRTIVKRGKRIRRSTEDLARVQASILAAIRSKQGQRLEEIGRAMKSDTAVLKRPMAILLATRKVRTIGARRGTRYFLQSS